MGKKSLHGQGIKGLGRGMENFHRLHSTTIWTKWLFLYTKKVCSTSGLSVDLKQAEQIGPDLENAMGSRRVRFRQAWSSHSSQPCADWEKKTDSKSWSAVMHVSLHGCGPQETGRWCFCLWWGHVRPAADAAAPCWHCLSCPCYYSGGQGVMPC